MMIFNIDPIAKPRMTRSDTWRKRKVVSDYWSFKDKLVLLAKEDNFVLPDLYTVKFIIRMPDSWSVKRKAEFVGRPHQQKPDLDNLIKALNDCLKDEDKYVYHISATKIWGYEGCILIS